jgi:effector-binding domain-containing protein
VRDLIGLRGSCDADALERAARDSIAELVEAIPAAGEEGGPPVVGVYPLELEGRIDFFVGVEEAAAKSPRSGTDRVRLRPTRLALTTHLGRYDELQLAYFPLLAYAHERGLTPGDVVRETYIDDPETVAEDRVRTEVALPIDTHAKDPARST